MEKIPKIINYIWLSENKLSFEAKKCISSWKNTKNYQIKKWDAQSFLETSKKLNLPNPLNSKYVQSAIKQKKWAFASDYLRQWILYNEGGIYLDTDVYLKKEAFDFFDKNLDENFVSCMEIHNNVQHLWKDLIYDDGSPKSEKFVPGICIQAAFLMGKKGNKFSNVCLNYYENKEFIMVNDDGATTMYLAPDIYAHCARQFNFKYKDNIQVLKDNTAKIYPSNYISSSNDQIKNTNIGYHLCSHTWSNDKITKSFYRNWIDWVLFKIKIH